MTASAAKEKRAFLVGINYVGTGFRLYGCANDQTEMYHLLRRNGYAKENILFLSDDSNMSQGKPTYAGIDKGLRWLLSGASSALFSKEEKEWPSSDKTAQLFFGYSGHGSYIRDFSGTETDGNDEVLIPLDYASSRITMSDNHLRKSLVDKVPKEVKLTALIDCCHSGTMLDLRWKVSNSGQRDQILTFNPKRQETRADVLVLSGCLDSQTAAENYYKAKAFGLLTSVFLQYMEAVKDKTTCFELLDHINKTMKGQTSLLTIGKNRSLYSTFNL